MKQLTIVVKPFCAEAVLRAIAEMDIVACLVREAKGYSRQKGYLDRYVGSEYSMAFLPKVEIGVWVSDARAEEVADRIVRTARTGRIGDGKIFIVPRWRGRIRWSSGTASSARRTDGSRSDHSSSAGCRAGRPVKCSICLRQEKPGATRTVSPPASAGAGKSRCSPTAREIS